MRFLPYILIMIASPIWAEGFDRPIPQGLIGHGGILVRGRLVYVDSGVMARAPIGDAQMKKRGWSTWQIAVVLYPFGAGAMAVNAFFASLIGSWIGGPVLSSAWSIALGCAIGGPVTFVFARHIRRLMDEAEPQDAT